MKFMLEEKKDELLLFMKEMLCHTKGNKDS